MTQPQGDHGRRDDRRTRIALAAITGLLAGTARAVASWLLDHLTASR